MSIETINNYISTFSKDVQIILKKIQKLISETNPDLIETINYGVPTFKLKWKNFIHFWAFKNHISLFPWPEIIEIFSEKLANYKISKWTIQFSLSEEIPFEIIKEIVEYKNR